MIGDPEEVRLNPKPDGKKELGQRAYALPQSTSPISAS
jgi:hypothetical protein